MQIAKHILSAILILAILSSGLPIFSPEDANRDTRVNLEDLILHVRDFARTAEKPATFTASVEKVLSTLYVVAGLKMVIKQADEVKSTNTLTCLDLSYLVFFTDFSILSINWSQITEKSFNYESIILMPSSPPPRAV